MSTPYDHLPLPEGTQVSAMVEKYREGEDAPYETVVGHPDGTVTVINHEEG